MVPGCVLASDADFASSLQEQEENILESAGQIKVRAVLVPVWPIGAQSAGKGNAPIYSRIIDGLTQPRYFRIYLDGKEQKLLDVLQEEQSFIRLGVLIEAGDAIGTHRIVIEGGLKQILEKQLRPADDYFFAIYDRQIRFLKNLGEKGPPIKELFKAARGKGREARFRDALAAGLDKLSRQTGPVKRILLVFRAAEAAEDASATSSDELKERALRANVQVVYFTFTYDTSKERLSSEVSSIPSLTGGMNYVFARKTVGSEKLEELSRYYGIIQEIYASLKRENLVGFSPSFDSPAAGACLSLRVELDGGPEVKKIRKRAGVDEIILAYPQQYCLREEASSPEVNPF
ncbi:MAG: hypothetical protein HY551_00860 [Elusimicrobia bacterium]|nr:hypothetical protein [Elusimicrobiota bacterium]